MKSKEFFISYHYQRGNNNGNGYVGLVQKKFKPLTLIEIEKTLVEIKKQNGFDSIVLINFGRYER